MRKMIATSLEEAARLGHEEAGPEHLLLAITRDPDCGASFMLRHSAISEAQLRRELQASVARGTARIQRAARASAGMMHILDIAAGEADRRRDRHVGTEHVALALTRVNSNLASAALTKVNFTSAQAESALNAYQATEAYRQESIIENIRSPGLRKILRPLKLAARAPAIAWKIFVRRSLGHPRYVTNQYPLYRRLREREPVRRDPLVPVWTLMSYDDTMFILRDPRFKKDPFASQRLPKTVREQLEVPGSADSRTDNEIVSMLFLDAPDHTRVRGVFTKAFTPARIEGLRPRIQQICDDLLDRIKGKCEMELIADFAAPLPVTVIADLLGFPREDYQQIKRWSDDMTLALGFRPSAEAHARASLARAEVRDYFNQIVERIKANPGDNLLSALLANTADVLTPEELFGNSILLLAAGHETTTNLIGTGVLTLLRHPDQLRDLREHPDLIGSAVEEMLRYEPPGQWNSRVTGEPVEIRGVRIPAREIVLAAIGAANRDPEVFADPERFDIRRKDNRHLSFGAGAHFCLGAALARMEAAIAINTLLARFPNLRLAQHNLKWHKGLTFRGLKSLRMTC